VSAAVPGLGGATPRPRRTWGPADLLTALRLPLAAAFVLVPDPHARLLILAVAGLSDVFDGIVARRLGPSRIGEVLDPIVDKIFMLAAVLTVVTTAAGVRLGGWEIAGLLLRDIAVTVGVCVAFVRRRRRVTIPARLSGKVVSVMQFATIAAILLDSAASRPLAWGTAAVSVWAIVDYARIGIRMVREAGTEAASAR
jgi:CDP-diacylglycerol--glycerol-3-phosphate 3-phosphatidyltransferase/cardiolipin synthase